MLKSVVFHLKRELGMKILTGTLILNFRQVKSRETEGLEDVFENLKSSESVPREYQSPEKKKQTNKKGNENRNKSV